ncbi:hypothetical protein [Bacillus atrophaeus]|uniref:hypothetical protein n=1 Tax=Bacillus atrophaeus TaxID=1452 RepID=UPI00077A2155|nr:hypothetical protein [Bacillus atrophaeus]KXZ13275.1 hypothetical protein AXI57_16095 [Bacillus atrophaeus]MED4806315.1 hypothetical protein [Bacillus atrophaeus]UFD97653.1 hypothetical protein [Bacillus atrophaeus]GED04452.1 hypothetical protein BAT02nite_40960 [Bacillus atrophaeus]
MNISMDLNSALKDKLKTHGYPATRENIKNVNQTVLTEMLYSFAGDCIDHLIETNPENLISEESYQNMVGSMSLDDFLDIAEEEYKELTGIPEPVPFKETLWQISSEEKDDNLDDIGKTFCDFIDTVILNFMYSNQYFSENEFIGSESDMHWYSEEQGIYEFDCSIRSIFERNGKYYRFSIGYVFTYKDLESELAFQECLTDMENSLKSQIQGCYQNDKPSAF